MTGTTGFKGRYNEEGWFLAEIGPGQRGGKASSLFAVQDLLKDYEKNDTFSSIEINIPSMVVVKTGIFEQFMTQNSLWDLAYSEASDARIANAFQKADLPFSVVGELRQFISSIRRPLAVRSSSLLEDAKYEPFAGIYATKMIPNNQPDVDRRFRKLTEAIKLVYASTFFAEAKAYMQATKHDIRSERMAIVIQEVIGEQRGSCFYPEVSGVARSFNFYPSGRAKPEQGIVNLAFGLGKTIVDGGCTWNYCPSHPRIPPPFGSPGEMMKLTQKHFWSVNCGEPPSYDPIRETEFLVHRHHSEAEEDDTLRHVASTMDPQSGRITLGVGPDGPRLLDFAPLLTMNTVPLNALLKDLIRTCEEKLQSPVEIEFAMTFPKAPKPGTKARFGFLQVRPMVVSLEKMDMGEDELKAPQLLMASRDVMGNGLRNDLRDIVFVKPGCFEARNNPKIAMQLNEINKGLLGEDTPYLLIGFGRWGSTEPWLGIPVNWSQISGAKCIVEATLPQMNVDMSQGSHFFHNLTSFQVSYFSVPHNGEFPINWEWLDQQNCVHETEFVKHVRLKRALMVKVDGFKGWGTIDTQDT